MLYFIAILEDFKKEGVNTKKSRIIDLIQNLKWK